MNRDQITTRQRRSAWSRDALMAGAIVGAVALLAGGSVVAGAVGSAAARDAAVASASVLAADQRSADRLPTAFPAEAHGSGGIDPASTRLLSTHAGSRYWIALDRGSNVCLVAQSTRVPEQTAASCVNGAELEQSGAALQVDGAGWQFGAVLLPDSVDESSVRGPWRVVAANLVVVSDAAAADPIELVRESGARGAEIVLDAVDLGAAGVGAGN